MSEGGWGRAIAGSLLGALIGAGGLWLARHDTDVKANAVRDAELADLVEFKKGLQQKIEDAKVEHQRIESDLASLKAQVSQSAKERRAIYRWIDMVSARTNVPPPALPEGGGGTGSNGRGR